VSSLACCLVISTGTCTSHSHPSTACTEQEASGGPSGSRTNGHESDQPLWIIGDSERDARRWVPTDREAPVVVVAAVSRTSGRPVLPGPRPGWNLHLRVPIPIGELKPLARAQRIGSDHGISIIIRRSCRGSAWSARLRAARAPPLTAARS